MCSFCPYVGRGGAAAVHWRHHPSLLHVHEEAPGNEAQAHPAPAGQEEGPGSCTVGGEAAPAASD
jgi:hypothetical protein